MPTGEAGVHRGAVEANVGQVEVEQRQLTQVRPAEVGARDHEAPSRRAERTACSAYKAEIGALQHRVVQHGTVEVGAGERGTVEHGAVEPGAARDYAFKASQRQAGSWPVRADEARVGRRKADRVHIAGDAAVEAGAGRFDLAERGPDEQRVPKVCADESGAVQPRAREVGTREATAREVNPPQIASG